MQSGTGTDLNTKQGEVSMAIELLNLKMIQGYVHCLKKLLKGYLADMPVNNADPADLSELNQQSCDGIKASEIVC